MYFFPTFHLRSQSNLSQDLGSAGPHPFSLPGMKLEAVMEHLQRQQEAKVEVNLQEKHPLQAQFLFAQQAAAAAAARASASRLGSALLAGPDLQPFPGAHPGFSRHQSGMEEEEDAEDSDKEEQEGMLEDEEQQEEEEDEEEDDDGEDGDEQENDGDRAKRPRFQPAAGFPFLPYPAAEKQPESVLPPVSKQEQEEKEIESPQAFTSPNGLADWSFEERYRQVSLLETL